MGIDWRGTLRHGLQVLAFCCGVAVLTTAIWSDSSYGVQLAYSSCIGMTIWAVIEFGRLLIPQRLCHPSTAGTGHGWPKGAYGVLLSAVGIGAGYFGGNALARALLGEAGNVAPHDWTIGLLVTIGAGAVGTFYFYTRGKQAALQASIAAAERDASQARLMLLQSQLEPHMLFNTLANLRALIAVDPSAAQHMLDRLDGYLRATLGASRATTHPLADEFARLADYLELMAVRMGARLRFALDLPEPLRALPVPTLLLQPLVENAIRHGLEPCVAGGQITVSAARRGDTLMLTVCDSGAGFDPAAAAPTDSPASHFGLAQVRERVATAYGGRGRVDVQSQPGAGTTIRITLPLDADRP